MSAKKTAKKATQKRGRSANTMTEAQAAVSRVEVETPRTEKNKPKRPARVPMHNGIKLGIANMDPNYHYAWIQDKDGKIDEALAAYYEFHMVDGQKLKRASGNYPLYAMKLEIKYWEEDQRLKHEQGLDKLRKQQVLAKDEYIPGAQDGRHHVIEKDDDYDPLA